MMDGETEARWTPEMVVTEFDVFNHQRGVMICLDGEWYCLPRGSYSALEYAARADKAHHCTDATRDVMAGVIEEMQVAHIERKGEDPIVMLQLNDEWYVLPVGCHRTLETAARLDQIRCDDPDHNHTA